MIERGARRGIGRGFRLAARGLRDIDPQLALERGRTPALERRNVARLDLLGGAELLDGGVDLADLGERLAGARVKRGLRTRIAFEVTCDLLLERGELRDAPARRTIDSSWSSASRCFGSEASAPR